MAAKHFTVAEVERLIPRLEQIFVHVLQLRAGLRALEQKLERAGVEVTRESVFEDQSGTLAVRQAKAVFRGYYEALADELLRVRGLGGEVKDLEMGLVDFVGRRGDEEVHLCWKMGEKAIGFWHPVGAGYASRRPIDEGIAREPPRAD